jgi:hypothetical protein
MSKSKLNLIVYPKTIYTDVVGMPDPLLLGITIHYYNHSDVNLYMKIYIDGPSPWSSNAVALGLLNSGLEAYINLDNFTSRTKPVSATTEVLTLTLRGYSDSGYSNLLYEFSRSLTVVIIKSDDGTWTTDFLNNFDDGTVQGWAGAKFTDDGYGGTPTVIVSTDYVLSTPYSLRGYSKVQSAQFSGYWAYARLKNLRIQNDNNDLIFIGRLYDIIHNHYIPINKWMRFVVPLPKNTTSELRITWEAVGWGNYPMPNVKEHAKLYKSFTMPDKDQIYAILNVRITEVDVYEADSYIYVWLDDFKIISK